MNWNKFDENNPSTYPPIDKPVLISYSIINYLFDANIVGWATLKRIHPNDKNSGLYWYVEESTPVSDAGPSPLENSQEVYGTFGDTWVFVKHWALLEPYNDNT